MIVLVTLLCIFSLHTSQCVSFRYTNTSCLETYKLGRKNKDKITCTGEHVVNHCIPDDQHKEVEVCVQWKWITPGYCPYYDKFSDVIKEGRCSFYCLRNDDLQDICTCPSRLNDDSCNQKCKNDFGSDKYILCEPEKSTTISATVSITIGINGTKNSRESQFNGSAMGIVLGVIVPLILLVVVPGIVLFKKRRHTRGTSRRETAVERGEDDALMDTETRCLEENEQNQQPIEKDERTSTDDKEASTLLAENKNENQSEGHLDENQDTSEFHNFNSPQKNKSFKTPPTTPAVQTEPGTDIERAENKGDKKNKKKEGEGSRGGHNSSEDVSPRVGAEKKTEEGSIEGNYSTDAVSPDNGAKDDPHLSGANDKFGDNGNQTVEATEEDQSEKKCNKDQDVELHVPSVTDKSSNQTVKTDLNDENNEIKNGCGLHADGSSGEQNSEQEDVSVDNTQNSNSQNDNGGDVSRKYVDKQEHEHESNLKSSADSSSERDENEEYTSRGIFVDSLESIMKKDDEEGGWSEVQELLEYMCTVPARKILYSVLKMYVDNPDNYFQDESKKALLKSVLPTEFHSALDHVSEYRHSIPVLHAILQVSLSEEHQPKSGWGQKVKYTDTGVGDDVERVHQAHTLSREIQNPEEISVDGYGRIFEMFIGAVERLDIHVKGKCSEDYREIVRRWENIQRKQWVMDKWNTFTNTFTKFTEK